MILDLTKPLMFSDGTPVSRVLATDLRGPCPVVVTIETTYSSTELLHQFPLDGGESLGWKVRLVNAPPRPVTLKRWFVGRPHLAGFELTGPFCETPYRELHIWGAGAFVIGPIDIIFTPPT